LSRRLTLAAGLVGLVTAAPAVAAYVCHPDAEGTKRLTLQGKVGAYSLVRGEIAISIRRGSSCARVVWRPARSVVGEHPAACVAAGPSTSVADDSRRIMVVRASNADRPDRVEVFDRRSGSLLHSWPVFNRPLNLDVDGDTALFTAAKRDGVYGLRLSDGRIGLVGANQRVDVPQIDRSGIVYQDDLYKSDDGHGRVLMKFVPRAQVERDITDSALPIRTGGIVRAFSMDGQRVAIAVADPRGVCDRILFWNVSWHSVSRLTSTNEATCDPGHAAGGITDVALGGITAEWATRYGSTTTVLSANIIACREWVLTRLANGPGGDHVAGLAADGALLTYAVGRSERELRGQALISRVVRAGVRSVPVTDGGGLAASVSVDSKRIATLRQGGTIDIRSAGGALIGTVDAPGARAIALRAHRLAALTRSGRLQLFSVPDGRLLRSWPLPAGVGPAVDLHYGVAVVTAGTRVYAVDAATGRVVRVAVAPAPVAAEIEAPGIVYQFNRGGHGFLRLIPFAKVEAALR
jgi:hypothetical protein